MFDQFMINQNFGLTLFFLSISTQI